MKLDTTYKATAFDGKEFHHESKEQAQELCRVYEASKLNQMLGELSGRAVIAIEGNYQNISRWNHVVGEYMTFYVRVFDTAGATAMSAYLSALSESGFTKIEASSCTFTEDMVGQTYVFRYYEYNCTYERDARSMEQLAEDLIKGNQVFQAAEQHCREAVAENEPSRPVIYKLTKGANVLSTLQ